MMFETKEGIEINYNCKDSMRDQKLKDKNILQYISTVPDMIKKAYFFISNKQISLKLKYDPNLLDTLSSYDDPVTDIRIIENQNSTKYIELTTWL